MYALHLGYNPSREAARHPSHSMTLFLSALNRIYSCDIYSSALSLALLLQPHAIGNPQIKFISKQCQVSADDDTDWSVVVLLYFLGHERLMKNWWVSLALTHYFDKRCDLGSCLSANKQ